MSAALQHALQHTLISRKLTPSEVQAAKMSHLVRPRGFKDVPRTSRNCEAPGGDRPGTQGSAAPTPSASQWREASALPWIDGQALP